MADQPAQRSVSIANFPADIDREAQILSDYNACSKTEFILLALRLFLDYIYRKFPEFAALPLLPPRRNNTKRRIAVLDNKQANV